MVDTREQGNARVVELVDTLDLKSNDHCGRAGSSPASSTEEIRNYFLIKVLRIFFLVVAQQSCDLSFYSLSFLISIR